MTPPVGRGIAAGVVAALLVFADSASAGFSVVSVGSPSFTLTLNGSDQVATSTMPLTVDNSGLGVSLTGWNLTITSTQYATGGGATLATDATTITGVTASCAGVCTSNPSNSVGYPVGVPAGAGPPAPVKFFNAASTTGVGTFNVTPTLRVAVPANAYAGGYTSTLTVALVSGP
jgi:hypothetical protein